MRASLSPSKRGHALQLRHGSPQTRCQFTSAQQDRAPARYCPCEHDLAPAISGSRLICMGHRARRPSSGLRVPAQEHSTLPAAQSSRTAGNGTSPATEEGVASVGKA